MTPLEIAALEAALRLLVEAVVQKKVTPEDVTKQLTDMIWAAVREAV